MKKKSACSLLRSSVGWVSSFPQDANSPTPCGDISQKVIEKESTITCFPESSTGQMRTLAQTTTDDTDPKIQIYRRRFAITPELDYFHTTGESVGPFSITNAVNISTTNFLWRASHGSMMPQTGSSSTLIVTRMPEQDEPITVTAALELEAGVTNEASSEVRLCPRHVFSVDSCTTNFAPQLGETANLSLTLTGCSHANDPGWLEVEIVREVIGETQHVAWVDMDLTTTSIDRYGDTTQLSSRPSFTWDGIAQASLPLADHPDVFNGPRGSMHRAMPAVEVGQPVPPPFYTIRTRFWNDEKTAILAEENTIVFVPQVVKINYLPNVASLLATPMIVTNKSDGIITVYAGTESNDAAEQILLDMPQYLYAFMPDEVNIRFVNPEQSVSGSYTSLYLTQEASPTDEAFGVCLSFDPRNSSPSGLAVVYVRDLYKSMRDFYRYKQVSSDSFTVPLSVANFSCLLAEVSVHEVAHSLGLVDAEVLNAISKEDPHNLGGTGQNMMDIFGLKRMSDVMSPSKTRYWRRVNRFYMEFCLPKKKWGEQ